MKKRFSQDVSGELKEHLNDPNEEAVSIIEECFVASFEPVIKKIMGSNEKNKSFECGFATVTIDTETKTDSANIIFEVKDGFKKMVENGSLEASGSSEIFIKEYHKQLEAADVESTEKIAGGLISIIAQGLAVAARKKMKNDAKWTIAIDGVGQLICETRNSNLTVEFEAEEFLKQLVKNFKA